MRHPFSRIQRAALTQEQVADTDVTRRTWASIRKGVFRLGKRNNNVLMPPPISPESCEPTDSSIHHASSNKREGSFLLPPQHVINLTDSDILYRRYYQYKKVISIARLTSLGLPVLPGFVVDQVTDDVLEFLRQWATAHHAQRLSLRFDSTSPKDNMRLMGANPTIEELAGMSSLVQPPVVAIILAENDRFAQSYSIISTFAAESITCEIVGPGFDASDITRGQINPHERFIFWRKGSASASETHDSSRLDTSDSSPIDYRELQPSDIAWDRVLEHTITSPAAYAESVRLRYGKIYAIIQVGLGHAVKGALITRSQMRQVDAFLEGRHASLPPEYAPIGCDFGKLAQLYGYLAELDLFHSGEVTGRTLSASFLRQHGLVFWDLYGSDKYYSRGTSGAR